MYRRKQKTIIVRTQRLESNDLNDIIAKRQRDGYVFRDIVFNDNIAYMIFDLDLKLSKENRKAIGDVENEIT